MKAVQRIGASPRWRLVILKKHLLEIHLVIAYNFMLYKRICIVRSTDQACKVAGRCAVIFSAIRFSSQDKQRGTAHRTDYF